MKTLFRLLAISVFFLAHTACGGGGGGSSSSTSDSDSEDLTIAPTGTARTLTVSTYNLGLLPRFVELTDERVAPLQQALGNYQSDVLCLQEVWRPGDRAAIIGSLSANYPEIFELPAQQKFTAQVPACTLTDIAPALECLILSCAITNREFTECALNECGTALDALAAQDPQCAGALFAQAGRSSSELSEIQDELFSSTSPAGLFTFEGSNGVILASKFPLTNREVLDFFDSSTTSHRVALLATVTVNGIPHRVGCAHLTSNLDGLVPYTGAFGSWQQEGQQQVEQILAAVQARSVAEPVLLAGDFNCSIANGSTGVQADFSSNCERFLVEGYRDFAAENLGCSFCTSNTLNSSNQQIAGTSNLLLDHVFTRDLLGDPSEVALALTSQVTIAGQPNNLSDHFAVRIGVPVPGGD